MLCHVILPNSTVIEVNVDPKAEGQECLDQVCRKLGLLEPDYFGLQHKTGDRKHEIQWLNLRNLLSRQVRGTQPYRLELKVKFFVQPHHLLQQVTRDLFYHQVKQELYSKKLVPGDLSETIQFVALVAQAEHGPVQRSTLQLNLYKQLLGSVAESSAELIRSIASVHEKLSKLTQDCAKTSLLQLAAKLQNYGMEYHRARNLSNELLWIGICPDGVFEYNAEMEQLAKIDYLSVVKASQADKLIMLNTMDSTGAQVDIEYRLSNPRAAHAMYRSVTEMHSFFRCDTVHNTVSSQFSRDLKGTFVAIFNENSTLGKEYVFDIKRTSREALDHARREMFRLENASREEDIGEDVEMDADCDNNTDDEGKQCEELKEQLRGYEESMLCSVCKDAEISTVFLPCGHVTCCSVCAGCVNCCPLCRDAIKQVHRIYLPSSPLKASLCTA